MPHRRSPITYEGGTVVRKLLVVLALAVPAIIMADELPKPPVAKKVPKRATLHGDTRVDDYGWIREKSNPEVVAYLNAENAYADAVMASTAPLQRKLYDEIL